MSAPQIAAAAANSVPPPPVAPPKEKPKKKRGFFAGLVHTVVEAYGIVAFVIAWFFPPILYGVGYVAPTIEQWLAHYLPWIPGNSGNMVVVGLGVIGVLTQGAMANSDTAKPTFLLLDMIVSAAWWAVTWSVVYHYAYHGGDWSFWLVFPAVYTITEFCNGANIAMRNLYVRTPVDMKK